MCVCMARLSLSPLLAQLNIDTGGIRVGFRCGIFVGEVRVFAAITVIEVGDFVEHPTLRVCINAATSASSIQGRHMKHHTLLCFPASLQSYSVVTSLMLAF